MFLAFATLPTSGYHTMEVALLFCIALCLQIIYFYKESVEASI